MTTQKKLTPSEYVLVGRNAENSMFHCVPKWEHEKSQKDLNYHSQPKEFTEKDIIDCKCVINFYTFFDSKYTEVRVENGNLKSVSNETKRDNIEELPVTIM